MIKRVILLMIFIFLIAILSLMIFNFKYYPWEYISCAALKGEYTVLESPLGAPALGYKCVHHFTDGGKICKNNDDCQGNCLITDETLLENIKDKPLTPKVIGGTGKCEFNNKRHPCYPGDFENPFGYCI
ncbi:MAG: hypothetical protein PVJ52_02525 [Candidatus Woesebacteria bacterium]|jgi:hypothetical protein